MTSLLRPKLAGGNSRHRPSLPSREALYWIAPACAVIIFIFGYSVINLITQSLRYDGDWVGLENFSIVITDPLFLVALRHNLFLLLAVPILVLISFVLAITLF